jgi:hypothetical protein
MVNVHVMIRDSRYEVAIPGLVKLIFRRFSFENNYFFLEQIELLLHSVLAILTSDFEEGRLGLCRYLLKFRDIVVFGELVGVIDDFGVYHVLVQNDVFVKLEALLTAHNFFCSLIRSI